MNELAAPGEGRSAEPVSPLDVERLQDVLSRAVRKVCPYWLSESRQDIVQNAVVRIVRKWKKTEEPEALGASYLWRVAHSAVMDEIRRRRRHPEDAWEHPPEPASAGPTSTEARNAAQDLRGAIEDGLRRLPEDRRRAVALFLLGHGLDDSARLLGWKPKRVDNQRYQGLAALRRYLSERGYEP